jgi:hypothetical protein
MTVSTDQFIEEKMRGKSPQERADALIEFYRDLIKVNPPQETANVLASLTATFRKSSKRSLPRLYSAPRAMEHEIGSG